MIIFALSTENRMKRTAFILLTVLLSLFARTNESHVVVHDYQTGTAARASIEDQSRMRLEALAEILQDCRFELPQACRIHAQRHDEQMQTRRSSLGNKVSEAHETAHTLQSGSHLSETSHKAIATSRHSRGYYIYTLRHIII